MTRFLRYLISIHFLFLFNHSFAQKRPLSQIVVIGVDGMSPDGIKNANTPVMDSLRNIGAWSFEAQAVLPTSSSPNWASMVMGAGPAEHGITSNGWQRKQIKDSVYCGGTKGETWPTVFRLLKDRYPKSKVGIYHHWLGYGRLVENKATNVKRWTLTPAGTIGQAGTYLVTAKPDFLFVHLDHVDHAGHHFGHGTPEYYASVEKADKLIGKLLKRLQKMKGGSDYFVLVTADHGGKGKGHGGDTPEERTIPWIICGPQVASGKNLKTPINTYDTAATIAWIFGIDAPECWIAKPITEAFEEQK